MANTYIAIATTTVGSGGAASIDLTSIPQTYTDLLLKLSIRTNRAATFDNFELQFNNNTATQYSNLRLRGDGASASSSSGADNKFIAISGVNASSSTSNTFGSLEVYIPNYTGSTNKAVSIDIITETNASTAYAFLQAGLLSNTAAITSIKFSNGETISEYSTATLYGIKKD